MHACTAGRDRANFYRKCKVTYTIADYLIEAEPKKSPIKWIAVGIVIGVLVVVALAIGF